MSRTIQGGKTTAKTYLKLAGAFLAGVVVTALVAHGEINRLEVSVAGLAMVIQGNNR